MFRYRESVLLPILFPFLPVHRLGFIVNIPRNNDPMERCSNLQCNHGKCLRYSNNKSISFCQCESGWSGRFCAIKSPCECSFDSLCVGISTKNRSICLCPMNKFGPHCLLPQIINENIKNFTCKNGDERIPREASLIPTNEILCICPSCYYGKRCQFTTSGFGLTLDGILSLITFKNEVVREVGCGWDHR